MLCKLQCLGLAEFSNKGKGVRYTLLCSLQWKSSYLTQSLCVGGACLRSWEHTANFSAPAVAKATATLSRHPQDTASPRVLCWYFFLWAWSDKLGPQVQRVQGNSSEVMQHGAP